VVNTPALYYLVGPSGAGKDSLLRQLKKKQYFSHQPLVGHRYITRPVRENDENHIELSPSDFLRRQQGGHFLFDWESHGHQYAIGREVQEWQQSGHDVIVNGSRAYLHKARKIYPPLVPIWMNVSDDVLRTRLAQRGRENPNEIEHRIHRNRELNSLKPDGCVYITNNQSIEDTIDQLMFQLESRKHQYA
jgi:ribose 1,5-bisphosphokinase